MTQAVHMDEETRFKVEVCARIKSAREDAGLTMREAAKRLGVDERTYRNYESNRIPWKLLPELAELLGTTTDWIVRGTETEPLDRRLAAIEKTLQRLVRREPPQAGNGNGQSEP